MCSKKSIFKNTKMSKTTIKLKKGLNIPLKGEAEKILNTAERSGLYAIQPPDFHGIVPKMLVKEGENIKAGSPLFYDKNNEKIIFTSPVSGKFKEIIRGEKRRILEVRVKADQDDDYLDFGAADPKNLNHEDIMNKLLASGLWSTIRQRPYSVIANPDDKQKAIFVSAFDSAPLAPDFDFLIDGQEDEFQTGLDVLKKLTKGKVHLSINEKRTMRRALTHARNVEVHKFTGPHPSGNIGVQIHHIDPVNIGDIVWYVDFQNVIMLGRLFKNGIYDGRKIIALTGSEVKRPRYWRVIQGASVENLLKNNLSTEDSSSLRFISGNVLTGSKIYKEGFIGFYDSQVTVIPEGNKPEFMGWLLPKPSKYSATRTLFSWLMPWKKYRLDTNLNGGNRAFVLTGFYEKVLPMDILPMQLIKAIMINDIELMEKLGIYEVAPEDFALCEFICPSKTEMQSIIRDALDNIQKEFS